MEEREGKENYFRPVGALWEGETHDGKRELSIHLDAISIHNFTGRLLALECQDEKNAASE